MAQGSVLPAMVTVVLAVLHLAFVAASPLLEFLAVDLAAYDAWGRRLAAGDWLGAEIFYQDPLYPYLLGILYRLLTPSLLWIFLFQIAAAACTVVLVHRTALALYTPRTAAFAAWMMALYGPAIYYAVKPEKAALAALGLASMAFWATRAATRSALSAYFFAGLACGLTSLLRGNVLLVGAALGVLILFSGIFEASWPRRAARAAAVTLGIVLTLLPVAVRNRVVGGEWVLTTSQAGPNLFIGNHPGNRNGSYDPPSYIRPSPIYEREDFRRHAEQESNRSLSPSEVSSFYVQEVLDWAREDPWAFLRLQGRKARIFMQAWEIPDNWSFYFLKRYSPILSLPLISWGVLAPLACLGLALVFSSRRDSEIALASLALVYAGSVIGFYVFSRYRFPLVPLLAVFAARGLVEIVDIPSSRSWRSLAWIALVTGPAIALVASSPAIDPQVDLAHRHINLASSFFLAGDLERAEELVGEARALDSESHSSWLLASRIAAERGDVDEEAALLQRARELAPGNPRVLARSARHIARVAGVDRAMGYAEAELANRETYLLRRTLVEMLFEEGRVADLQRQLEILFLIYPDDVWALEQRFSLEVYREDWRAAFETASRLRSRSAQGRWQEMGAIAASRIADRDLAKRLCREVELDCPPRTDVELEDPLAARVAARGKLSPPLKE